MCIFLAREGGGSQRLTTSHPEIAAPLVAGDREVEESDGHDAAGCVTSVV